MQSSRASAYLGAVRKPILLLAMLAIFGCARPPESPANTPVPSAGARSAPLSLTYLGVAGWRLESGENVLLVDPHFSRLDIQGKEPLVPDQGAIARYAPARADAILVGHSHHDHLLDVPDVARRTGATILGTASTLNVARAAGLPETRLIDLTGGGKSSTQGPWTIKAVRSLHSLTGAPSIPIPREITLPMNADAYAEGGVLDYFVTGFGRTVVFISTANLIDAELAGNRADVAIVATGLREKIPDYTCRTVRALGSPRLVIANHFDAWWRPLGPQQMDIDEEGRKSLAMFPAEVEQCAPGTKVVIPTHLQPMNL
jgi:L-ascorbate metabolism protein UlaG (beta-lactamase superfamily)